MNTYPQTLGPSEPEADDRIPEGTLAYFQARNRNRAYDLVIKEFLDSGITQATLARRLGKGTDRVSMLLGAPGNWTLKTVSDLLFAISGAEVDYSVHHPLRAAPRNYRGPSLPTGTTRTLSADENNFDVSAVTSPLTATARFTVAPDS